MTEKTTFWTKLEVYVQIGILIFAIVAVFFSVEASNTANNIAQTNLKLSNYKVTIIPYVVDANLGIVNITGSNYAVSAYGNITLSLIVITPHDLILNNTGAPSFLATFYHSNDTTPVNGKMLPVLNQNLLSSNIVFAGPEAEQPNSFSFPSAEPPYFQQYEAFVQTGVTQVNFTIPVYGYFNLNPQIFTESTQQTGNFGFLTSLANFNVQIKVSDTQTEQSLLENYSGALDVYIVAYPPFTNPAS